MKKNEIHRKVSNLSEEETSDMLESTLKDTYTLVLWPDSQTLMEEPWFRREAILDNSGKNGSNVYFVPTFRIM